MEIVPVWLALNIGGDTPLFWGGTPFLYRCARSIENFSRIRNVVARASGMDLASSLRQNTFLTKKSRMSVGGPGSARDGGTRPPPDGGRLHESPAAFMQPNPPGGWGADVG